MNLTTKLTIGAFIAGVLVAIPVLSKQGADHKAKTKKIVLKSDNVILLDSVIEGESVAAVITKAKELDTPKGLGKVGIKNTDPIYIFLRTPGGEIQSGLEMLEALKGLNRPVDTITNFAASMGFQTVQQLGKRYITKTGTLMSHKAKGGFEGEFGGQKPSQIDSRKGFWESRLDEMDQQTVDRTNGKQTMESYQKSYTPELWLTGSQAVEQGYADEVVLIQCDQSLKGVTTHTVNFMGLVDIDYDLDKCPLNSAPMNIRVKIPTNKGTKTLEQFKTEGGGFGSTCLIEAGKNPNTLCATDTNLTLESISSMPIKFKQHYENIKNRVIPLGM